MRASNVVIDVMPPSPSEGELEHLLIVSDGLNDLRIVGSLNSMRAIGIAIIERVNRVEVETRPLSAKEFLQQEPSVRECMESLQLDPDQEITPTIANALMDVRDGLPPEAVAARYDLPWVD